MACEKLSRLTQRFTSISIVQVKRVQKLDFYEKKEKLDYKRINKDLLIGSGDFLKISSI